MHYWEELQKPANITALKKLPRRTPGTIRTSG